MGAVKYVEKDRRGKKKAKIVTYDWLEDSINAGKAIQDISAYNPGKPRDIKAMIAACRKPPKIANSKLVNETGSTVQEAALEIEGSSQVVQVGQQKQTQAEAATSSTVASGRNEKLKAFTLDKTLSSNIAHSSTFKKQPAFHRSTISEK